MKRIVYTVAALLIVMSAFILSGCADKTDENPTRPIIFTNGYLATQVTNSFSILFCTNGDPGYAPMQVYLPPGYDFSGDGNRYPTLYLLSPFASDELYYVEHGIKTVADRLIQEGKIIPMIIVMIDGRSELGGSFYANSARQGNYFDALFKDVTFDSVYFGEDVRYPGSPAGYYYNLPALSIMSRVENTYRTIPNSAQRGIGGVGMGGYGAFRGAILTDYFGSVSAVNSPLDFDGSGSGGFLSLINDEYPAGSNWNTVDTSTFNQGMSMLVSGAAAFSAQDVAFTIDSLYYSFNGLRLALQLTDTLTDNLTSFLPKHRALMPFNPDGSINSTIWNMWLNNNIPQLYADSVIYQAAFNSMDKLLVYSNSADFHFDEQMTSFESFLTGNGITHETETFTGTDYLSPTADHFLYDLLEDILIFHSNSFTGN